jgi:hypothetical protein
MVEEETQQRGTHRVHQWISLSFKSQLSSGTLQPHNKLGSRHQAEAAGAAKILKLLSIPVVEKPKLPPQNRRTCGSGCLARGIVHRKVRSGMGRFQTAHAADTLWMCEREPVIVRD